MFRIFTLWSMPHFLASRGNVFYQEILRSEGIRGKRKAHNLVPAYSIYGAIENPPPPPPRLIPTDVPVKEPIDVPLREPHDVPPAPQPERPKPTPTKEPYDRPPDPVPRPIP